MIEFDQANDDDLPALIAMLVDDPLGATREQGAVDENYRRAFADIAADPAQKLIVARDQSGVVGLCQLSIIPGLTYHGRPRGQIEGVRIAKSQRGVGLGSTMIQHAIDLARQAGCCLVQLTTDKRRPEAIRFYEGLGFTVSHEGMKLHF